MDGRPAGWLAGRPNLKIMLTSAQLGLAGAWAELGNKWSKNLAANNFFFTILGKKVLIHL